MWMYTSFPTRCLRRQTCQSQCRNFRCVLREINVMSKRLFQICGRFSRAAQRKKGEAYHHVLIVIFGIVLQRMLKMRESFLIAMKLVKRHAQLRI